MEWAGELVEERTMGSMRLVKILIADTRAASHLKCTPRGIGTNLRSLDVFSANVQQEARMGSTEGCR